MSGWMVVGLSAVSLGSAAAPIGRAPAPPATQAPVQLAQNYAQAYAAQSYSAPQASTWATYKVRLAALARLEGVRQSTIDANVPALAVNERVIELERTEPVAQTYGGYIGALAPYLRTHVTQSLISRGRANYADHYQALSAIEARYGVDPAVL